MSPHEATKTSCAPMQKDGSSSDAWPVSSTRCCRDPEHSRVRLWFGCARKGAITQKSSPYIPDEPLLVAANKKTKGAIAAVSVAAAVASSLAHTFGRRSGLMVAAATSVVVESWHWTRMLHPNPRSLEWISGGGSGSLPYLRCSWLWRGDNSILH